MPDADPDPATAIQESLLVAVHAQPGDVVTVMLPLLPAIGNVRLVGDTVKVQAVGAGCVTVNVWPAIVKVAVRWLVPVLAATVKPTDPLPLPLAPLVMVIHDAVVVAVHGQPAAAVTETVTGCPAASTVWLVGEIDGAHVLPAWFTVNVLTPIVIVPLRFVADVFAATVNATVPPPVPLAPDVSVIQAVLLPAVQPHPIAAATATVPLPPAAANDCDAGEIAGVHGAPASLTLKVCPPIVSVPDRVEMDGFGSALKVTEPLPEPVKPAVIVIHVSLFAAVHEQPAGAVTVTVAVPPVSVNDCDAGESAYEQLMPVCVTV